MADPSRLEVGRIGRAHGLRGEVSVAAITDRDERFALGSQLYVNDISMVVIGVRRHQDRWLVLFEGITDRSAAEALQGLSITADPIDSGADELWIHELIGARVVDKTGTTLGMVTAIEANPAHDLLVLDTGPLIPMVFVTDHTRAQVTVEVPEGLLDVNERKPE